MKQLSLLFISLFFLSASHACSCWGPAFCEMVHSEPGWLNQGYHVQGVKVRDVEHGMELQVLTNYGKSLPSDIIRVWGDLGWLCREYTGIFADGDTIILNLLKIGEEPAMDIEQAEDFQLSFCGIHYLRVKNDTVHGALYDYEQWSVLLEDFEVGVMEDQNCNPNSVAIPSTSLEVVLYPNPFSDYLLVNTEQSMEELVIYDAIGRVVTQLTDINRKQLRVVLDDYATGAYFVNVIFRDRNSKVIKIVKT